jgi:branched-chain amino acid transport system permease protein
LIPAIAVSVVAAWFVGWLGFRFRIEGVYFALLTIAFAEVARIGFDHLAWTGAAGGFFLPVSRDTADQWWNLRGGPNFFYYLSLSMAVAALAICARLRHSRLGYQWLATREDAEAARAIGINVTRVRIVATVVSGAMTSLGGVFYAFYYNNLFSAQIFDMSRSIDIVLAPIVGGIGTLFGPIVGAFILIPLGELLTEATRALGINFPGVKAIFYGLGLMIIIGLAPGGVWPAIARRLGLKEDRL